ncbi:hypothetical protein Pcinc_015671 [Petrolisthes cinctipes]|uniref:Ionotropic glutamate receptor L-glutamate and glycine-binding domain-containing protein n=1 Tax=Petrolisthes cinctipes TaxID=88211 RepID=A0AAE1FXV0_PETCI|nr:hypothetical protein Pcinc_015671 [Petrolisthes cinctipes]
MLPKFPILLLLLLIAVTCAAAPSGLAGSAAKLSKSTTAMNEKTRFIVEILEQLVRSPARNRSLQLHLDPALPAATKDALMMWSNAYSPSLVAPLHVVIVISYSSFSVTFSHLVAYTFSHLLLVNLEFDRNATTLLMQPILSGVRSLSLLTPVSVKPGPLATYTFLPFCSPRLHYLGHWSQHTFPTWESLFPDRFPSTCQATFRLATWINDEPYLYRRQRDNKTVGVSMTLLQLLANKLNFSYTMTTRSVDGLWGTEENGEWNGLLGMIQHSHYHFTINSFLHTEERLDAFDVAEPITYEEVAVFLQKPAPLPKWMNLVRPFPIRIWGLLTVTLLLASGCFVLQAKVGGRGWNADMGPLRAILGQSSPYLTEPRLFAGLWLLICFVLTAAYTSNLVGVFTKPAFPPRLTTLSQLLNSEKRLTTPDVGTATAKFLKDETVPFIRAFRGRVDLYTNESQCVAATMRGTHGFLGSTVYTSIIFANKYKLRNWYRLEEPFNSYGKGWIYKKNMPFKEEMNKYIRKLKEAGLMDFWQKNEYEALGYTAEGKSGGKGVDGVTGGMGHLSGPLTTSHLQGHFTLLSLAWALSTFLFLLETIHKKSFCYSLPPSLPVSDTFTLST